jgi:hypothetical protein
MIDLTELKAAVAALVALEDDLAMDKALGEIDRILYELRSECIRPAPRGAPRQPLKVDLDAIVADLLGGTGNEEALTGNDDTGS